MRRSVPSTINLNFISIFILLTLLVASGCTKGNGGWGIDQIVDELPPRIVASPDTISTYQGDAFDVQVDVENLPEGEGLTGYAIDFCKCEDFDTTDGYCTVPLSEEAAGIDIETTYCDAGTGSAYCEEWSFSVGSETETGCYFIYILPTGETTSIINAGITIEVSTPPVGDTTPPVWSGDVLVAATTDPGMVYVEWGTAVDAQSPPVTYLVYLDTDNSPWDGTVVEKSAAEHWHTFNGLAAGYYWVGVRARDSASPANIDQNNDVLGLTVEAAP